MRECLPIARRRQPMSTGLARVRPFLLSFFLIVLATSPAFGIKGSDVQFHGTVTRVDRTATPSVTVRLAGFDVTVRVSADTEFEFHGDDVDLADVRVGDFLKVSGYFANS